MEKDIKVLKELIIGAKLYNQYEGNKYYKAIENLIARNKELESALDNSVSKDEIKEKIEEINNEKLNYSENEYYLENEIKGYAIDKIQELLNKGE